MGEHHSTILTTSNNSLFGSIHFGDTCTSSQMCSLNPITSHKRRNFDDDDDFSDIVDEIPRHIVKKPKVSFDELPFLQDDNNRAPYSPRHSSIANQIENQSRDLPEVIRLLLCLPHLPLFPASEWKNILLDRFVDFDILISDEHPNEAEIFNDDGTLASINHRVITKVVKSDEWAEAWDTYCAAVTFIFPSRVSELQQYRKHIRSLFRSVHPDFHYRVVDYDRAARRLIAKTRGILFDDFEKFSRYQRAYISDEGIAVVNSRKKDAVSQEVCRNFTRNRCRFGDSCRRRHVYYSACKKDRPTPRYAPRSDAFKM